MVYMNELEDLESVNDKVKVKLEEFKSQNFEHSSIPPNRDNKCEKAKFMFRCIEKTDAINAFRYFSSYNYK
jgi:hypothetical protein